MQAVPALAVVALAVAAGVAPIDASLVENWYSTGVYPLIQQALTSVSNLVPFAWLDVFALTAFCAVVVMVVRSVILARRKKTWRPVLSTGARLATAAALTYLAFLAVWGLNYRRVSMTDRLVLDRDAASPQAIRSLGRMAVEQVNALHSAAHAEGWRISPWRERRLRGAYESVLARLSDAAPAVPGRLKSSLFGPYFRWTSVDGMINPFGLEAIANPDLLPFEQPFVAAHEWAHLAGYADESEASFVGFLTCIHAAAPAAYSGWLFLYWEVNSEVGPDERRQLGGGARRRSAPRHRRRRGAHPPRAGSAVARRGLARVRPVSESESCRRGRAQLRSRADAARARAIRAGLATGQTRGSSPVQPGNHARTIRPAAARRRRSWMAAPSP